MSKLNLEYLNNTNVLKNNEDYIILDISDTEDFIKFLNDTNDIDDALRLFVEYVLKRKLKPWEGVYRIICNDGIWDLRKENLIIYKDYSDFYPLKELKEQYWYFEITEDINNKNINEVKLIDLLNKNLNTCYNSEIEWEFSEEYLGKIQIKRYLEDVLNKEVIFSDINLEYMISKKDDIAIKYPSYSWLNAVVYNNDLNKICIYVDKDNPEEIIRLYAEALKIKNITNKEILISGRKVFNELNIPIPEQIRYYDNEEIMGYLRFTLLKDIENIKDISPVLHGYFKSSLKLIEKHIFNK